MTRALLTIVVAVLLVVPAFAEELDVLPLGANGLKLELTAAPAGSFVNTATSAELTLDELAAELVKARVVLLGESHTDMAQKEFHGRAARRHGRTQTRSGAWDGVLPRVRRRSARGVGQGRHGRDGASSTDRVV